MSNKTAPAGWVIEIATPMPEGAPSKFSYFNVNEADAFAAIIAAKKKAGASDDAHMRAVRPLTSEEVQTLGLRQGQAKSA